MASPFFCQKCGTKLSENTASLVEVRHGQRAVRVYGNAMVELDCQKCGYTSRVIIQVQQLTSASDGYSAPLAGRAP